MPSGLRTVQHILIGVILGWVFLYGFLAWHGVDLVRHSGEWHIVIDGDNSFVRSVPDQRGHIHQVLHCFFWHQDDPNCLK